MLEVKNIVKSFDGKEVLKGIDFKVDKGEKVIIIGPSGSGKSTFLRTLNLLESIDLGDIVFEDFGKKSLMLNLAPLEIIED